MHCDSLVGEETKGTEKEETPIVHEPPRRCLIELPQVQEDDMSETVPENYNNIMISDFLFPGETAYDAIDSVSEVFGFQPAIDKMDDDQELLAGIQHLNMTGSGELTAGSVTHTVNNEAEEGSQSQFGSSSKLSADAAKRNYNLIAVLLSVIVAIVGISVSYLAMSTGTNASGDEDEFVIPSRTQDHHPHHNSE